VHAGGDGFSADEKINQVGARQEAEFTKKEAIRRETDPDLQ